jgi:hypothetical protein
MVIGLNTLNENFTLLKTDKVVQAFDLFTAQVCF